MKYCKILCKTQIQCSSYWITYNHISFSCIYRYLERYLQFPSIRRTAAKCTWIRNPWVLNSSAANLAKWMLWCLNPMEIMWVFSLLICRLHFISFLWLLNWLYMYLLYCRLNIQYQSSSRLRLVRMVSVLWPSIHSVNSVK